MSAVELWRESIAPWAEEKIQKKGVLVCPKCASTVPLDPPYWTHQQKFYCSQYCAQNR